MNGHHHCLLSNGKAINETDPAVLFSKVMEAVSKGLRVTKVGFVCTYGCGRLHPADEAVLGQINEIQKGGSK